MERKVKGSFAAAALIVAAIDICAIWPSDCAVAAQPAVGRQMPVFEVDPTWPKIPAKFKVGTVSDVGIDAHDNAWLLSRPRTLKPADQAAAAPPVMVFDPQGNYIKGWGGPGPGYQWPQREHSVYVDDKGFVWITGNYCKGTNTPGLKPVDDDQLLKFTRDGKFVLQMGHSDASQGNSDTENFNRPAYVQVNPKTNELFVADGYGNHRIIVFDADTGRFKRMWGAFGKPPVDDDHCGRTPAPTLVGDGPRNFSTPHTIRISSDDLLYVADRENRRIQVFSLSGKFIRQVARYDAPFANNLAFSPDPDQTLIYTAYDKGLAVLDRKTLRYVGTIRPQGFTGPGHLISTDSKGNIYVTGGAFGHLTAQRLLYKGMGSVDQQ
jgi:DNA-binding beta-propeller fold protein YncE